AVARARVHAALLARRARAAESTSPAELVEVVEGDAIGLRVEQLQRAARREVCFFDVPPFMSPGGENPVEPGRLADGVRYRAIYDRVLLNDPLHIARISRCIAVGEEARTHADLPMKLMIVDHEVAVVPLMGDRQRAPSAAMFIRPSVLLDSVAATFEVLWSRAVPLRAGFVPSEVSAVSPEVAEILGLLASGMKDEVIARHLGVNVRTVRRRIRAALDALGVDTRFQAGVQAGQLGVLE
ncbi:MAG: helix-turn-helix domain-containing protein, partial [Acidimicrobiales bacterium]